MNSRCVLLSDPDTFGAGSPSQNTPRIQHERSKHHSLMIDCVQAQSVDPNEQAFGQIVKGDQIVRNPCPNAGGACARVCVCVRACARVWWSWPWWVCVRARASVCACVCVWISSLPPSVIWA